MIVDPEPPTGLQLTTRELCAVIDLYKRDLKEAQRENERLRQAAKERTPA